jgi:hypothetical protein
MKKRNFKYLIAFFFILLFLFKGVASVYPGLLNIEISEKLFCAANEEEKKNAEEKAEQEAKAFYLCNDCESGINLVKFTLLRKSIQRHHLMYKQSVYISIITPPPEIV